MFKMLRKKKSKTTNAAKAKEMEDVKEELEKDSEEEEEEEYEEEEEEPKAKKKLAQQKYIQVPYFPTKEEVYGKIIDTHTMVSRIFKDLEDSGN